MNDRGEKITIYIPGGLSRRGIKVVDIVNWTGQVFICQREEFEHLESEWKDEIEHQGIYILFGRKGNGRKPDIYIAEAENIKIQLRMHLAKTDFWEIVFILINKDENVNKTHFKYLEARMMGLAIDADQVNLESRNIPPLPSISRSDQSMAERYLGHAIALLDSIGFSCLQPSGEGRSFKRTNEAREEALRDADGNSMRGKTSPKDGYGNTERNSPKRTRIEHPRVKDMMAAGVMKAGDVVWFKKTPDRKAILTVDGRCEYEGEVMSLTKYGKIVSGWGAVTIYVSLIHGPSGKTIGDLRERLPASTPGTRPRSVSTDRPPSYGKKAISRPDEGNSDLGNTPRNPSRINLPKIDDMMAAGAMRAGDAVWFKRTPDKRAILTADGRCIYKGEEMSLVEYGKIVSGWTAVNVYQFFIHGPSGKTIEDLRDRLIESNSDTRTKPISNERPSSYVKKARSITSVSGIRLYFDSPKRGVHARGIYFADGFLVLEGSSGPREVKSYFSPWGREKRESLIASGEIEFRGDLIRFMQDIRFKTASTAAEVISGGAQNGRVVWKDKDGKTLKEIQEASS